MQSLVEVGCASIKIEAVSKCVPLYQLDPTGNESRLGLESLKPISGGRSVLHLHLIILVMCWRL